MFFVVIVAAAWAPVRFVTRFNDYTDPATRYTFHCHLLEHEDRGMMGQFVVVQPGDHPAPLRPEHHHGH